MSTSRIKILFSMAKKWVLKASKGSLNYAISNGLICGNGCVVSKGSDFGSEPYLITLHDNVRLSTNVSLITHDGSVHTIRALKGYENIPLHGYGRIEIGENTFLGANVIVLPNVSIGKNCIIGAGSIVTHSIPDNCVAAGIPAKIIESIEECAKKKINLMPGDWDDKEYRENTVQYLKQMVPPPPKAD